MFNVKTAGWFTLLVAALIVAPQKEAPHPETRCDDETIIQAVDELKHNSNSDSAHGRLQLRFKRSGRPPQDWFFTEFDVVLMQIGSTWTIVGTAGDRRLDITLDEGAKTLKFILGDYVWNLQTTNPKISITTSPDRPEILIRFEGSFEATGHTGRHYNLMSGSVLAVKAS